MIETKKMSTAILFGIGTILLLATVVSFFMALLAKLTSISDYVLMITTFISAIISMVISGFISGVKAKVRGWLAGGATGMVFSILVFLVNYLGFSQAFTKENILYHLGLIVASTIGGIFGVNKVKNN